VFDAGSVIRPVSVLFSSLNGEIKRLSEHDRYEEFHREATVNSKREIASDLDSPRVRHHISASNFRIDEMIIRPICAQDRERFLEFFKSLSPATNAFRFLALKKRLLDEELTFFTQPDGAQHVALVALVNENGHEFIVGTARFIMLPEGTGGDDRAELAVTVADEFQGKGIGARLVLHLIPLARERGVEVFDLYASQGNTRIWRMVCRISQRASRTFEGGVVHITFFLS
jgi:GNAT superfamily N-acetyltransferase